MVELKNKGKTVFLNSHLLSEIEMICDRVAIINKGSIVASGSLEKLLAGTVEVEMQVEGLTPQILAELSARSRSMDVEGRLVKLSLGSREEIPPLAEAVVKNGGRLFSLESRHSSLEDLFVDLIQGGAGRYADNSRFDL
jgi:ABC-2 type transport system ATP-binding protein